jgi:hypothetical protein
MMHRELAYTEWQRFGKFAASAKETFGDVNKNHGQLWSSLILCCCNGSAI